MRNKSNKQNGFAIFEVLFFVLLAAVLVGVAFYVGKKSSNDKNQTKTSANTITTTVVPASPAPVTDSKSLSLASGKVNLSYSSKEWILAASPDKTHCGQSVLSKATCVDAATLVLQKDGDVNTDQFQVNIGVFDAAGHKDAKSWYLDYLDASDGGQPDGHPSKTQESTTKGLSSYFEQSDYGANESRLGWGVVGANNGVVLKSILFKGDHYSFKTNNDYLHIARCRKYRQKHKNH